MNRRDFIKTGAVAAVAAAAQGAAAQGAAREIKVAVVGCGGRGTGGGYKALNEQDTYRQGALGNILQAAKILREQGVNVTVKPVAFADYFLEKAQGAANAGHHLVVDENGNVTSRIPAGLLLSSADGFTTYYITVGEGGALTVNEVLADDGE